MNGVNGHSDDSQTALLKGISRQTSDWIVQKFGGTSVGKFATKIVDDVIQQYTPNNRVAVVCSARSSSTKSEGTTNRLLRAVSRAESSRSGEPVTHVSLIDAVRQEHIQVADELIRSSDLRTQLKEDIKKECAQVLRILDAAEVLGEITSKCRDMVISAGEKLSCRFMAALLLDRGVDAEYVDLADIVDFAVSGQALDQDFYNRLAMMLGQRVGSCTAKVPVITGYFGPIPGGLLEKVGRGYTDLCAALVAVGLRAQELQVWKEVDGIFTADPRKVPTARLLSSITPAEAAELTFYGSEVIHPFTMEQVIRARIPILIKNVMKPRGKGTRIFPDNTSELEKTTPGHDPRLFRTRGSSVGSQEGPKRPTAVTAKPKILVINVHSNKRSLSHGFFANIFKVLDKWKLSIDLISTSEVHVSLALHSEMRLLSGAGQDEFQIIDDNLRGAVQELGKYGTIDIIPDMAILSLVGKQMKNMVGVAGKMFTVLGEHNVNIEMISQGASEINISCVIEERDSDRALNIIHTNLFTFLES